MQFKLLQPADFPTLKPFFEDLPYTLSVYSLPSIIAWRDVDEFAVRWAIEDGALLMTADNGADSVHNHMALPLPAERFGPERLLALALELGSVGFRFGIVALPPLGRVNAYEPDPDILERASVKLHVYRVTVDRVRHLAPGDRGPSSGNRASLDDGQTNRTLGRHWERREGQDQERQSQSAADPHLDKPPSTIGDM